MRDITAPSQCVGGSTFEKKRLAGSSVCASCDADCSGPRDYIFEPCRIEKDSTCRTCPDGFYLSADYGTRGDMINPQCLRCGIPILDTMVACFRW